MGDDFDLPLPEPPKRKHAGILGMSLPFGGKHGDPSLTPKKVDKSLKDLQARRNELEVIELKLTERERILANVEAKIQSDQRQIQEKEAFFAKKQATLEKQSTDLSRRASKYQQMLDDLDEEVKIKRKIVDDLEENIKLKRQYLQKEGPNEELFTFMRIVDNLLGELPDKKIKQIIKTKDFAFYEQFMRKYSGD